MELTIAPYGYGGPAYGDIDLRAHFGFGVEGRFFPLVEGPGKGFFAVARPFEIGFIPGNGGTAVPFTFSEAEDVALDVARAAARLGARARRDEERRARDDTGSEKT